MSSRASSSGFNNDHSEEQLNDAIPIIDSVVAVKLVRLHGIDFNNFFTYAISLQCRDGAFKQAILSDLFRHDSLCNNNTTVKKKDFDLDTHRIYDYGRIKNAMLSQIEKGDTDFLRIATKEFEFWAPMVSEYFNVVLKPGIGQLSMGNREFKPCVLASVNNCGLWVSSIYYITGKEEYGSANEEENKVYRKFMKMLGVERMTDHRKDFVRFGKEDVITSAGPVNTLDLLNFDTIPGLKEKLDKVRKEDNWKIVIYTNGNKAFLYMYYTAVMRMEFSKQLVSAPSLYLVEISSPTTIRLTKINYRDRYYF